MEVIGKMATKQVLSADRLAAKLLDETLSNEHGFTMTKTIGTVKTRCAPDGRTWILSDDAEQAGPEVNRSAVLLLRQRFPELNIRFCGTTVSETTVFTDDEELRDIVTRTDALIEVPDSFVQFHCGAAFRQLLQDEWQPQLTDLVSRIVNRLRKHELRTTRMFGASPYAAAAVLRITEDTAESDIWVIPLQRCGFYPLQWDGEVCGMALLLAERLREALAEDCGSLLETAVQRDDTNRQCALKLYYSIKQD